MGASVDAVEADNLGSLAGVRHAFFARTGGVSEGIYSSLNCGQGSGDAGEHVAENRGRAMAALGLPAAALATAYQIHSADVWHLKTAKDAPNRPKADAVVIDRPGLAAGVLTADCGPVLMCDAEAGVAAAAHAGWRGALSGVLEATVAQMEKLGAQRARIHAALGPCIRQASYEVGDDFRGTVLEAAPDNGVFFEPGARPGHHQFDLAGFIGRRLGALGLASVGDTGHDTYDDETRFFSYRRTTHRRETDYGRGLSVISLGQD